jgi:DNA modification methylase
MDHSELFDEGDDYTLYHGDCIPHMFEDLPEQCMDFAVFSPPFPAVYAYTHHEADLGNAEDMAGEAKIHFSYFFKALKRVMKPGRAIICHVQQIPRLKRSGEEGLFDFRGLCIRLGERAGLIYEYDWSVAKNPQAQAIRTHSHELQFAGLERDRANARGALCDYLIKFQAPGINDVPVDSNGEVSRSEWIDWAESSWHWRDIKATDTLNTKEAKGPDDTRHICPLQLSLIQRVIKLFTNPGEIVFSPFAGIGSEGYIALKLGRKFYGCELKDEYVMTADKNLAKMAKQMSRDAQSLLF